MHCNQVHVFRGNSCRLSVSVHLYYRHAHKRAEQTELVFEMEATLNLPHTVL